MTKYNKLVAAGERCRRNVVHCLVEMINLTIFQIVLALSVTLLAAITQASVGFGFGMVAVPFLALIDIAFVPGATLLASILLALMMSTKGRSNVDKSSLPAILLGLLIGTVLGAVLLTVIPSENLPRLFGGLILLAVILSALGLNLPKIHRNLIAVGLMSGVMGTMIGIHGPPFALLYQRDKGEVVRPTLALLFLIGYIISLVSLLASGLLGVRVVYLAALIAPAVLVGYLTSCWVTPWLDNSLLRPSILVMAGVGAISLLIRG